MKSPKRGSSSSSSSLWWLSSSSSSVQNCWNRILLLLFITAGLNLTYFYQIQQQQHGPLSLIQGTILDDVLRQQQQQQKQRNITTSKTSSRSSSRRSIRRGRTQQQEKQPRIGSKQQQQQQQQQQQEIVTHKIAGLSCQPYNGGPPDEIAAEMVYWSDIESDAAYVSPFQAFGPKVKYLTFEPDMGGFNNVRMAMETVVAMAHAMGRTLVLPPEHGLYFPELGKSSTMTFADFFHFDSVAKEHVGINVISFEEFIRREAWTGNLRHHQTGQVSYPPNDVVTINGTTTTVTSSWNSHNPIFDWMRSISTTPIWNFEECVLTFPAQPGADGDEFLHRINDTLGDILAERTPLGDRIHAYRGKPTPVDAPPEQRFREILAHRKHLCLYDTTMQQEKVIHMMADSKTNARLLVPFYAFLFFEDWRQDLWTKRFVRDHLRYVDEIQCAAARVVQALREKARARRGNNKEDDAFDAMHIRRGDFQYTRTRLDAPALFEKSRDFLMPNSTTTSSSSSSTTTTTATSSSPPSIILYIATDERNKTFFDFFKKYYDVYFLDDFDHLIQDMPTNYYGMLDQCIASRARTFVGTYFSTFSGYINRMRGYHSQLDMAKGYETGIVQSYHFIPDAYKDVMLEYMPIFPPMWGMEFPVSWRDLDRGLDLVVPSVAK